MFHRRNRSASATARPRGQVPAAVPGPAQTAAAQAFLASRHSSANLSASAAAAALRSMSPTPTPVSQVQTKRMLQRQLSNSSAGRPGLQRQNSSGSMTERTFRSPSPSHLGSSPSSSRHPPVPAVPHRYSSPPPLANKSDRRAFSMEPPPRVVSPAMRMQGGRGASPEPRVVSSPRRPTSPRVPSLTNINELERSDSRGSTNFSYPLNARPNSPTPRSSALHQSQWAPGKSPPDGASAAQAERVRQEMLETSDQPVKKKKSRGTAEGSHFHSGPMAGRPAVTHYDRPAPAKAPLDEEDEYRQTPIKKKKKATTALESPETLVRPLSPRYSSDSDSAQERSREKRAVRASGTLNKQPSIVREDSEGEREAHQGTIGSPSRSPESATKAKKSSGANVSRKIDDAAPSSQHSNQAPPTLVVNRLSAESEMPDVSQKQRILKPESKGYLDVAGSSQSSRQPSISPSRSTRFSSKLSSDLSSERKHEPLPRSISPAKSALKQNSPSPRGVSPGEPMMPGAWKGPSQTPSEASDNTSMASTDGIAQVPKKKKSVRVSFDEAAEVVGTAAPPVALESPGSSAKWLGAGKTKGSSLNPIPGDEDLEMVYQPRPELPSFGSIRGKRPNELPAPKASSGNHATGGLANSSEPGSSGTWPSSSNASSLSNDPTLDTSVSSDHAIGHLISQESTKSALPNGTNKKPSNLPLPPEVTSVEGTGYASEESDSEADAVPTHPAQKSIPQPRVMQKVASVPIAGEKVSKSPQSPIDQQKKEIPKISVHPATPNPPQEVGDEFAVSLPGVFPSTDYSESAGKIESKASSGLGITKQESPKNTSVHQATTHTPASFSAALRQRGEESKAEESSDGDSIYSDAEEDLSYMEGGFGSINAIVDSPIVKHSPVARDTPPDSPMTRKNLTNNAKPTSESKNESWEKAQAHWSDVAQRQRQGTDSTEATQLQQPKTKKKKKFDPPISAQEISPRVAATMNQPPEPRSKTGKAVPTEPKAMRKSMNSEPGYEPVSQFRNSMRNESGRSYQRDQARQPVQPATQPIKPKGTLQKKNIPPARVQSPSLAAASAAGLNANKGRQKPAQPGLAQSKYANAPATPQYQAEKNRTLRRTLSNASDSSSSFQRRRKGNNAGDGNYSMRRSMRSGGNAEEEMPRPTSPSALRRGIRSLSPINRRSFSPVNNQNTMRTSMRTSYEGGTPTMRTSDNPKRSSSTFSGFGKSKSRAQLSASPPPRQFTSFIKSRFADSDDEDAPAPKTFRSRFENSSDDEPEPVKFRPVRGIPKKADEGDSTDLEDSSDEKAGQKKKKLSNLASQGTNGILGAENGIVKTDSAPQSPTSEKKRGFFARFRSKKPKDDYEEVDSPVDSPVQQGSHLSRFKSPQQGQDTSTAPSKNGRPENPQRVMSDSWPLPPKMTSDNDDRPFTSDGIGSSPTGRYQMAANRPRPQEKEEIYPAFDTDGSGKKIKKKRFPMLRRAFGLYD